MGTTKKYGIWASRKNSIIIMSAEMSKIETSDPPAVSTEKVPGKINRPIRKMRNEVLFSFAQVWY